MGIGGGHGEPWPSLYFEKFTKQKVVSLVLSGKKTYFTTFGPPSEKI